jgi:hypothetical protein
VQLKKRHLLEWGIGLNQLQGKSDDNESAMQHFRVFSIKTMSGMVRLGKDIAGLGGVWDEKPSSNRFHIDLHFSVFDGRVFLPR